MQLIKQPVGDEKSAIVTMPAVMCQSGGSGDSIACTAFIVVACSRCRDFHTHGISHAELATNNWSYLAPPMPGCDIFLSAGRVRPYDFKPSSMKEMTAFAEIWSRRPWFCKYIVPWGRVLSGKRRSPKSVF